MWDIFTLKKVNNKEKPHYCKKCGSDDIELVTHRAPGWSARIVKQFFQCNNCGKKFTVNHY